MNNLNRVDLNGANEFLRGQDSVLAQIIGRYEIQFLKLRTEFFESLVKSVIGQQLSVKAANTIYHRFEGLLNSKVIPQSILNMEIEKMRAVGVSNQKSKSIKNIAQFFLEEGNELTFNKLTNDEIIEKLTSINGVGVWTVQMFLIFSLGRLNVFPETDAGFLKSLRMHYSFSSPLKNHLEHLSSEWNPYQSVAALYLWKALDEQ